MTEQEMWEAVQRSDTSYDGLFFYAVKTTSIFCRPSCHCVACCAANCFRMAWT